jgi:hypothetical protein
MRRNAKAQQDMMTMKARGGWGGEEAPWRSGKTERWRPRNFCSIWSKAQGWMREGGGGNGRNELQVPRCIFAVDVKNVDENLKMQRQLISKTQVERSDGAQEARRTCTPLKMCSRWLSK